MSHRFPLPFTNLFAECSGRVDPRVKPIEEDEDANKLWLIAKYLTIDAKTNEFKLTGGETIKLGRVKFIVREI